MIDRAQPCKIPAVSVVIDDKLKKLKINSIRLIFTVEKFTQCDKIIDMYKRALNGEKNVQSMTENTYTRGHFYRGVL